MAATAYGILVGTLFKTPNQALSFGAISIVILSAIGGIWVPLEVMPPAMQFIGHLTPLNWGLEAINDLYLRNGGFPEIIGNAGKLIVLCLAMLYLAARVEKGRIS